MAESREYGFAGTRGRIVARVWPNEHPRYVAILVHGYGEHIGRYEHVADSLVHHGAAVYGADHLGHGRSDGERVLIEDYEDVVTDVRTVDERARADHPGLPVVVIGHSMGGLIAARYAQRYGDTLAALVLSGPVLGEWEVAGTLLALDELPDTPLDTATLSRDPSVGETYAHDPLVWHGPFKRTTLRALDATIKAIAKAGPLGALPTRWIHGADDRLVPLTGTRVGIDEIRGSDLTELVYPEARHEVFNETNKAEVLADVTTFIDRVLTTWPSPAPQPET